MNKKELKVLSPTAILGYGFPEASFEEGMKRNPDVIAVDAGSTDPGPYYLGKGISFTDKNAVKRDMEYMLKAAVEKDIPVIIGSAGGSGAKPHLDWNLEILREISEDNNYDLKVAIIPADIDRDLIKKRLKDGKIEPLYPAKQTTEEEIEEASYLVAQMGPEPIIEALNGGAQVIITGRTYDPAVFAALAIKNGFDPGLATHMGKILECAAIAALPGSGSDSMFGYLGEDYFEIEPLNPDRKCTELSVAAHTLYEKEDPYNLPGPGGYLDLKETKFKQVTDSKVRVTGSKFVPTDNYYIKLEGATRIGYRTVSIAGTTDPIFIKNIDTIIKEVKARVEDNFANKDIGEYYLNFRVYGQDGVMSMFENIPAFASQEVGILFEAVAETQEIANTICSFARSTMLHYGYEGRKATAGNLAFPFSPSDIEVGEVFNFSQYHLMEVDTPIEVFPVEYRQLVGGEWK